MKDNNLSEVERELVKKVLTSTWLSMDFVDEDWCYANLGAVELSLSQEQMNLLANAIDKI
jgi:hypothetical protein